MRRKLRSYRIRFLRTSTSKIKSLRLTIVLEKDQHISPKTMGKYNANMNSIKCPY